MRIAIPSILAPVISLAMAGATSVALSGVVLSSGCGDTEPEAQQLARINKDLALVIERVDALGKRVEALESRQREPAAAGSDTPSDSVDEREKQAQSVDFMPMQRTVEIAPDGALSVDGKAVELDKLVAAVIEGTPGNPPKEKIEVLIKAGPSTQHGKVVDVMDRLKAAGINKLAINPL